ncbi:iron uptake transporter deferrochelatase/peroxidase subunit [Paenibacillus sp. FSL W7-1088]|uniref:iron uptake transporter deferrochelatase/peroxidase subunit n=1 Tax=Paenibacillus sp. FSL W7-1088 TaxID=2921695 RepID=UPI0030EBD64C
MTEQKKDSLKKPLSRREMLKLTGVAGLGLLLGGGGASGLMALGRKSSPASAVEHASPNDKGVPFYGKHQAGIITPAQDFICFAAFDVTAGSADDLRRLFKNWTAAAAPMAAGEMIGEHNTTLNTPPTDTGEAAGLTPSRTTLTFGVGPSLFDGRFGLQGRKPKGLRDLPAFAGDALDPQWCGGDLCVQVCADDMQVAFHAIRNLARIARGHAVLRWTQEGFQRTGRADPAGGTPRNLLGFKDGTGNPDTTDAVLMDQTVWAQPADGPGWMAGGSYMAVRRVRMRVEVWDRSTLKDQEATFGRHRDSGAPLGSRGEFDPVDLKAKSADGQPVIPATSHLRLAKGDGSQQILRRSYSYSSGLDAKTGQLDAGLLFISYQRDLEKQFIPIQKRLAKNDKLNEYTVHTGSAVFACFPGIMNGGYIGDTLI